MICIKPEIKNQFICPRCASNATAKEILIQPVFTMADCTCEKCNFEFYQTLPISHTITDTLTIGKSDERLWPLGTQETWLSRALLKAYKNQKLEEVRIEKIIYKKCDQVVVLNALDFLYGHVLLKHYNSVYHLDNHKQLGLILIIPKSFEWLVPAGCAEVWVVDLKLSELTFFHSSIQKFVTKEFERFDTIYLSKAYSHPDFHSVDIGRFTGTKPFDLANFLRWQPTFTFVLREDRWWLPGTLDYWFYRLCRVSGVLKFGSRLLSMRQNRLVKKTISLILKKLPDAIFFVTGLGVTGNFNGYARDERKNYINDLIEKDWCRVYSRSHVVIGFHGSNMLLPTAHAAACVEILPEDRYGNMVQDISVRYSDRKQLYFYRFADQYARPKTVANKVTSIIENFEIFEKNMCRNVYETVAESATAI